MHLFINVFTKRFHTRMGAFIKQVLKYESKKKLNYGHERMFFIICINSQKR